MSVVINSSFDAEKHVWNLKLGGEIDIYTSTIFKEELQQIYLSEETGDVHIDASELEYIDYTGLGVLIGALKRIKQKDKDIYIKDTKPNVKKIFNITGLDKIFKLEG